MLYSDRIATPASLRSPDLFLSVLENTEAGMAVVDTSGQTIYINSSLRRMFGFDAPMLPAWCQEHLRPMIERMRNADEQVVEKWVFEGNTYRVRGRPLGHWSGHISLEVTVAHAGGDQSVAELLGRSLKLSHSDAQLLELLWRGMSNEEVANKLNVRIGTVKSRLFRLYQKLGVRRRPAAVLRAAEVIAS